MVKPRCPRLYLRIIVRRWFTIFSVGSWSKIKIGFADNFWLIENILFLVIIWVLFKTWFSNMFWTVSRYLVLHLFWPIFKYRILRYINNAFQYLVFNIILDGFPKACFPPIIWPLIRYSTHVWFWTNAQTNMVKQRRALISMWTIIHRCISILCWAYNQNQSLFSLNVSLIIKFRATCVKCCSFQHHWLITGKNARVPNLFNENFKSGALPPSVITGGYYFPRAMTKMLMGSTRFPVIIISVRRYTTTRVVTVEVSLVVSRYFNRGARHHE